MTDRTFANGIDGASLRADLNAVIAEVDALKDANAQALAEGSAQLEQLPAVAQPDGGNFDDLTNTPELRTVSMTSGASVGAVVLIDVDPDYLPVAGSMLVMGADLRARFVIPTSVVDYIFPAGVATKLNEELGGTGWQGGASTPPPSQFGGSDWTLTNPDTTGDLTVTITTLPSDNGSALTAVEYEKDGSGSWVALPGWSAPSGTGAHTISGLTDGVLTSIKLRAVNANGDGPASAAKTATPTAPSYVPVWVDNDASAFITSAPGQTGADSAFLTFAINFEYMSTGAFDIFDSGDDRVELRHAGTNNFLTFAIKNTSNVLICAFNVKLPANTRTCLAISFDGTTGTLVVRRDGVVLLNTGDLETGYVVTTAPIAGTIDWQRAAANCRLIGAGADVKIADFFLSTTEALDPVLFHDGSIKDWSSIGTSPKWRIGDGQNAAAWNAAGAGNTGTAPLLTTGSFIAA
jgi:hypothetical protein